MKKDDKNPHANEQARLKEFNGEASPKVEEDEIQWYPKDDATTLFKLIWGLINQEMWDEARLLGDYLLALAPENPLVHFTLGKIRLGINDLDRAEQYVRHSLDLGGDNLEGYLLLAKICKLRGDTEGQLQWAQKAASVDSRNTEPLYLIAEAGRRLGRLTETEAALAKVIELEPENSRAHRLLGDTYLFQSGVGLVQAGPLSGSPRQL